MTSRFDVVTPSGKVEASRSAKRRRISSLAALRVSVGECAARALGIAAATIGCLGLLGWVLDVEVLKGVFTGGVTMVLGEDGRFVHTRCLTRDAFYGVFDTATIHHGGAGTFSR